MSASVLDESCSSVLDEPISVAAKEASELSDIFDRFVAAEGSPSPEWLTRLRLERPRRSIRCLSESTRRAKRVLDVILSATMLILLAPVMLLVAVAVKLTSRGPIIFRQERVGLNHARRDATAEKEPAIRPTPASNAGGIRVGKRAVSASRSCCTNFAPCGSMQRNTAPGSPRRTIPA